MLIETAPSFACDAPHVIRNIARNVSASLAMATHVEGGAACRAMVVALVERVERAMTLRPLDPFAFNTTMGMASALAYSGRLREAVAIAKEVIKKHVTWAHRLLAAWAAMAGDVATALRRHASS